jgi:LDH2 family malate/lactate/ureidoglycolate dehydrogenase
MTDLGVYVDRVDELIAWIKSLPLQIDHDEIRAPGERGDREAEERSREGIPIEPERMKPLDSLARRLGVPPLAEQ